MASSVADVQRMGSLATERQITSAHAWALLPKDLQVALDRNCIRTASKFSNLFEDSAEEARELSFELFQSGDFGS